MITIAPIVAPEVDRDTDFSITFTASGGALVSQINSVRAYPAGMGDTNSSNYPSWDTGVIFTSGTNSVTISGQHNSAFGGDEIIHIPKGASTRMVTLYQTVPVFETDPETGQQVQTGTKQVENGERPMSSSEFAAAKAEFPDLAKPTVTAGVANVPPKQEIISFRADSTNFVDRNITIEVDYETGGGESTFTTTVALRVKNDLNKFLTWIDNYLNTYSPLPPEAVFKGDE